MPLLRCSTPILCELLNLYKRLHAVVLLFLEMVLIGAEAKDPLQLSELYPLPLVAVTGGLGVWMAARLVRDQGVDPLFVW